MRIAVSSTQCNGKSYFINSFLKRWEMYNTPSKTYRDLIKDKNLDLNQSGTLESQKIIRDALSDQAIESSTEEFCIHDRCILDNLAYTLWLAEKGKITDDKFIADSFLITRETLKMYDIIFLLPLSPKSPVNLEEKETRDLDLNFREEINNIFLGINDTYKNRTGLVFSISDSPALIEIVGDEFKLEKTDMVAEYLGENGNLKESDEPLMKTLSEVMQEDSIKDALIRQVSN